MKVLTYIKDLPIKLINDNKSYINVEGSTLYLDEEGNRYAYVCFNNLYRKPFFSLILDLTQYDVGGHLVKKEKYYVPHCFGNKGKVLLERPILIDKECEALEVEIVLAVFSNKVFAHNELRANNSVRFEFPSIANKGPLMPSGTANQFNWPDKAQEVPSNPVVEAAPVAPIVEEPAPVVEEVKEELQEEKEVKQEVETPKEEAPVEEVEAPKEEEKEPSKAPEEETIIIENEEHYVLPLPRKKDLLMRVAIPILVGAIAVGIFLAVLFIVKGVVPSTPYRPK